MHWDVTVLMNFRNKVGVRVCVFNERLFFFLKLLIPESKSLLLLSNNYFLATLIGTWALTIGLLETGLNEKQPSSFHMT